MNHSPWIAQLRKNRLTKAINKDLVTDIAIVGGGIAGIATAFFLLTKTSKKVVLLEASRVAHGATGHNAGQVTSYFERGFASMVAEFGIELAGEAQRSIEEAWTLLDEIYTRAKCDMPFSRFIGHAGLSTEAQVLLHLENNYWRREAGLATERFIIAEHVPFLSSIPQKYHSLYGVVPHQEILSTLESRDEEFIAVISFQKGCINSALFCEEVVLWMERMYPERFSLHEHSPVHKVVLHDIDAVLDMGIYTVTASQVILCTNGFDTVRILDQEGLAIDTNLHHMVEGVIGYMSAYIDQEQKNPMAASYLLSPNPDDLYYMPDEATGDPYFLITRRPYDYQDQRRMLISVAGPEVHLKHRQFYSRDIDYPDAAAISIDNFIKKSYESDQNKEVDYLFTWHGLMGYTPNGIRRIGFEPRNKVLLYNLGCNGIGILPSVFGGRHITRLLLGEQVEPTIFDPQ